MICVLRMDDGKLLFILRVVDMYHVILREVGNLVIAANFLLCCD